MLVNVTFLYKIDDLLQLFGADVHSVLSLETLHKLHHKISKVLKIYPESYVGFSKLRAEKGGNFSRVNAFLTSMGVCLQTATPDMLLFRNSSHYLGSVVHFGVVSCHLGLMTFSGVMM